MALLVWPSPATRGCAAGGVRERLHRRFGWWPWQVRGGTVVSAAASEAAAGARLRASAALQRAREQVVVRVRFLETPGACPRPRTRFLSIGTTAMTWTPAVSSRMRRLADGNGGGGQRGRIRSSQGGGEASQRARGRPGGIESVCGVRRPW